MTQLALVDEGRNSAYSVILRIQYHFINAIIITVVTPTAVRIQAEK